MPIFSDIAGGQLVRQAWIIALKKHYTGEIKPSWVAAWEALPQWQQRVYSAVYQHLVCFLAAGEDVCQLTKAQKSQIVRLAWVCAYRELYPGAVEHKHTRNWQLLEGWEMEVDADIFVAVALGPT